MTMLSPLEQQNFQRLKVNRTAVLQELRVDHVLSPLELNSVLSEPDIKFIKDGNTTYEKSKRLLDILPTKGRNSNWYKHFRAALLNPSVDDVSIKHKYQVLVEFLDNTIIGHMRHPVRCGSGDSINESVFNVRYKPLPSISSSPSPRHTTRHTTDTENTQSNTAHETLSLEMVDTVEAEDGLDEVKDHVNSRENSWTVQQLEGTAIPYTIQYWDKDPDDFESHLEFAEKHVESMEQSALKVDNELAENERLVFTRMRQLEIVFFLWKHQRVSDDVVLCTCSAALDVIQHVNLHHLYFKYFNALQTDYDMDILTEIVNSYDEVGQWLASNTDVATIDQITNLGLNLIEFLANFGDLELAKQTLTSVVSYLANSDGIELWMPMFRVYVKGMALSNQSCDFTEADKFYRQALAIKEQISMVSFGQDLLDCSRLFTETSIMMRELGSLGPAYTWAQKSLQEVASDRDDIVVSVLCNASTAYSNQWKVLRSEDLAVEAVQRAKRLFGVYHPHYVKALRNFVKFSNEFRKDAFGVMASNAAANITSKIYGYNCLNTAEALAAQSQALMAVGYCKGDEYFQLAQKAYNIAIDRVPFHHPLLIPYMETLVRSLIQRVSQSDDEALRSELLTWAEGETKTLLSICHKQFGEVSRNTAQGLLLLADVYVSAERLKDAEDCLSLACKRFSLCLGPHHGAVKLTKSKLGEVCLKCDLVDKAAELLKETVDTFDTGAYYMSWYNKSYEHLISCLEKQESEELAQEYRSKHLGWKWTSEDNRREIRWKQLHSFPERYDSLLEKFELWRSRVKKVQDHIEKFKGSLQQSIKHTDE